MFFINNHKSILVYGGAFSPPTIAHEELIRAGLESDKFDQVWVLPCRDRPDKKVTAPEDDRLSMLNILLRTKFESTKKLWISDFELKLPMPTSTLATVKNLIAEFPGDQFSFLIGSDSLETLPSWPGGNWLLDNVRWVISGRGKINSSDYTWPKSYSLFGPKIQNISSTMVRDQIRRGQAATGIIRPEVYDYIKEKGLYE